MINQKEADRRGRESARKAVSKYLDKLGLDQEELNEEQQEECSEIYSKEIDANGAAYEEYCDGLVDDLREREREARSTITEVTR